MRSYNTIPAFTIVEAVVSMAVTAIILAIIFVIFSITSERLYDFKIQNEQIADLNRMTYSINKSIFESEKMHTTDSTLEFRDYNADKTFYRIHNKYIIRRKEEFIDTFDLVITKFNIDTLESRSKKKQYQRLTWLLHLNNKDIKLHFYKRINSNQIFNKLRIDEY